MDIWIPITLAAAAIQTLRFMLQKQLRATELSTAGATFARFGFGAPLAAIWCAIVLAVCGVPRVEDGFWSFALSGAAAQIVATMATVALFQRRNFAVGLTFAKLEVIFTALLGFAVLGDVVGPKMWLAIALGVLGVLALAEVGRAGRPQMWSRSTGLGVTAGVLFAVSAVGYRGASLEVMSDLALVRSAVTLAFVTAVQALAMAAVMAWREPGEVKRVFRAWRIAGLVGLTSMLGSLGWFTAFTLTDAASVKALAQVELLFGALATLLWFRERISAREVLGLLLVGSSVGVIVSLG